jgi:hypothetical protein
MQFIFEKLLTDDQRSKTMCVDGAFVSKKQLSHWPGNTSSDWLKADTSTEMAFKLLESERNDEFLNGIEIISNNHFDSDGILACYVLLNPDYANHHRKLFIDIATTSDFSEFTNEVAFKIDRVISDIDDPEKSLFKDEFQNPNIAEVMQNLSLRTFQKLPEIIENIDNYEELWKDDYRWYEESETSFQNQVSVFSNYGDCQLSILESTFKLHPIAKFSNAKFDNVLSVIKQNDGHLYQLEYKHHTWHDTTRPQMIKRNSFEPLVEKLNLIDNKTIGSWKVLGIDPVVEWDYRLQFSNENFELVPSKIKIYEMEEILFDFLFE